MTNVWHLRHIRGLKQRASSHAERMQNTRRTYPHTEFIGLPQKRDCKLDACAHMPIRTPVLIHVYPPLLRHRSTGRSSCVRSVRPSGRSEQSVYYLLTWNTFSCSFKGRCLSWSSTKRGGCTEAHASEAQKETGCFLFAQCRSAK